MEGQTDRITIASTRLALRVVVHKWFSKQIIVVDVSSVISSYIMMDMFSAVWNDIPG